MALGDTITRIFVRPDLHKPGEVELTRNEFDTPYVNIPGRILVLLVRPELIDAQKSRWPLRR